MLVEPRKNLFERMRLLQEAPEDAATTGDAPAAGADQANAAPADNPDAGEAESANDDDLDVNVDMNLDDPGTGDDQGGNNDDTGTGDLDMGGGDDTTTTDAGSGDEPSEEVKKGNTDLFASLTAEEQRIKIMELKKLYNDMYSSIDDLIDKLNEVAMKDIDPRIIVRITSQMEELRRIIQDYIINSFQIKTYYENDVNYSIFLSMFTTLRGVFDDIAKENERNQEKK